MQNIIQRLIYGSFKEKNDIIIENWMKSVLLIYQTCLQYHDVQNYDKSTSFTCNYNNMYINLYETYATLMHYAWFASFVIRSELNIYKKGADKKFKGY